MAANPPPNQSVFQQRGAEVVSAMTPQSTPTERKIDPLKFEGRKVTNVGAEVANVREQKLLEATKDYIDRYQQIVYVHAGEQILTDNQGRPRERTDREIKEIMIAASDQESGTYEPYTAFICAKILDERAQAQALAKQEADSHRQQMAESVKAFQEDAEEAQLLFGNFSAKPQEARALKKANPESPEIEAVHAAIDVYERANDAYQKGIGPVEGLTGITLGSHRLPGHEQTVLQNIQRLHEYYERRAYELFAQGSEIYNQLQTLPTDDPQRQSLQMQYDAINKEQEQLAEFTHSINQLGIPGRKLSKKEQLVGPQKKEVDPATGKEQTVKDEDFLDDLQEAQQLTLDFVQKRQAKIVGAMDSAVQVLQDDRITGLTDLTESKNLRTQYAQFEKIWIVQMGGDAKEVQRRVEWWGGLRTQERAAEQLLQTEQAALGNLTKIVEGMTSEQLQDLQRMQQGLETVQKMYRVLTSPPLNYPAEMARNALGLPPIPEKPVTTEKKFLEVNGIKLDDPKKPEVIEVFESAFLNLGGRWNEYLAANPSQRAELILQELNLAGNPNVNKKRLEEVLTAAQAADNNKFERDFGQPEVLAALSEIFPATEAPAQPEANAQFLDEKALNNLRELVENLAPQAGENVKTTNQRIRQEFQNGGDWYDYIEDNFGTDAAQRVAQSVQGYRGPGFFAFLFGQILTLMQTRS